MKEKIEKIKIKWKRYKDLGWLISNNDKEIIDKINEIIDHLSQLEEKKGGGE